MGNQQKKDLSILPSRKKGENKVTITFSNELTVNNVEDLTDELRSSLGEYDETTIKINNISNIDLAGLQLILSLKKHIEESNRKVNLDFDLTEDSAQIINNAGFKSIIIK